MLKEKIKADMKEALKSSKTFELGVIRMLLASLQAKEKEKQYKSGEEQLTEEEVISAIASEVKKRKDAIALYQQGGRPELAENEKKEIEVLQKYLPEQLSEEEIRKLVTESIASTGAKEVKDMGKVMADLNPKIKGKADGGEVSKIIKELLGK